jgi:enoyl-CoA hydratase/carnithine racemase
MEPILYESEGGIAVLTLNDPKTRNALSGEKMFDAFERVVKQLNGDLTTRAVILTGAEPAFCSGGNIRDMRDRAGMFAGSPAEVERQYRNGIQRIPRALAVLDIPLIAAVNGPAIGAGLDLACMCDIRIASRNATFAESFVKVGIVAGDGGAWLLPRVIGYSNAAEMAFTGDTLDADGALRLGLVSRVVSPEELMPAAMSLARSIAANPPQVVRWTKRLLREGMQGTLESALQSAAAFQALAHQTKDHAEALAAIFDKRSPQFRGE